jgi:hypothetical protein
MYTEPGKITAISDIDWHDGALWASGIYDTGRNERQIGVFRLNFVTGLAEIPIPAGNGIDSSELDIGGVTSDGTYLYVAVRLNRSTPTLGIVKFNPAEASVIPDSPFFQVNDLPDMTYGDGSIWADIYSADSTEYGMCIKKMDPGSGALTDTKCCIPVEALVYLDGRLWVMQLNQLKAYKFVTTP